MIKNFVIDHVLRGVMTKKNGDYLWSVNQITNPSLNVSLSDTAQAVDALGTPIQEFDRGRSAEFSAENSIFDLGLYAGQMGKDIEVASAESTINVPEFEEIEVKGTEGETVVLKHAPIADITSIHVLNGDGSLGAEYKLGTAASDTEFAYDNATHTITLPTGLAAETIVFVMYEYASEKAVQVVADAINFPKSGVFKMEVLGTDVCDPDTLIHAWVVFENAKLDGNVDYSFTTDGTHPFVIRAMQNYCDRNKRLFRIVIPDED